MTNSVQPTDGALSSAQAHVIRALRPAGRILFIHPPGSGIIYLARGTLTVRQATFDRLVRLGALVAAPDRPAKDGAHVLTARGNELWVHSCETTGQPSFDPGIDGPLPRSYPDGAR